MEREGEGRRGEEKEKKKQKEKRKQRKQDYNLIKAATVAYLGMDAKQAVYKVVKS